MFVFDFLLQLIWAFQRIFSIKYWQFVVSLCYILLHIDRYWLKYENQNWLLLFIENTKYWIQKTLGIFDTFLSSNCGTRWARCGALQFTINIKYFGWKVFSNPLFCRRYRSIVIVIFLLLSARKIYSLNDIIP